MRDYQPFSDWLSCPDCDSEDVELQIWWQDGDAYVKCGDCENTRYYNVRRQ